ncbi:MAG: hypothetical protein CMM47_10105 [Rhodospirillaceae bacterium]|nr:hypothetical protein [Rhodospirillaceae bacterium]
MWDVEPIVYMPVEVKERELAARVLMARALAERGIASVIGFGEAVTRGAAFWSAGIYLIKGLNAVQKRTATRIRAHGHWLIALDEEAFGVADSNYMAKDIDPEIAPLVDLVFGQGEIQRTTLVEKRGFVPEKVLVTGNPRADLFRTPLREEVEARATKIRTRIGRFVLVNTNTGAVNSSWGSEDRYRGILAEIGWFDPRDPEGVALVDEHLRHDRENFQAVIALLRTLASKDPDIPVIVRPHPTERAETWQELVRDLPSVQIVHDTEPTAWLVAADLVVVTGCTTGLEAFMLGTPVLSMIENPAGLRFPEFFAANKVTVVAASSAKAAALVSRHWNRLTDLGEIDLSRRQEALQSYIQSSGSKLAVDQIAEVLRGNLTARSSKNLHFAPIIDADFDDILKKNVKRVKWDKAKFSVSEVRALVERFDRHLGQRPVVTVRDLAWSTFLLKPT